MCQLKVFGRNLDCHVLVSAQLHFSIASCKELSLACIVFKISTIAVMWCSSVVLLIWMSIGAVMFSGFCAQLEATDVDILSMDRDHIIAIIPDSHFFTDNWKIQCCQLILAFRWLLIQHSTVSKGNVFQQVKEKAIATGDKYFGLSWTGVTNKSGAASIVSGSSYYGSKGSSFRDSYRGKQWDNISTEILRGIFGVVISNDPLVLSLKNKSSGASLEGNIACLLGFLVQKPPVTNPALRFLFDQGTDLHHMQKGVTLLHAAVEKRHSRIAKFLPSRGAHFDMELSFLTPVHQIASHTGHAGILKTLLEFNVGADVTFSRFLELDSAEFAVDTSIPPVASMDGIEATQFVISILDISKDYLSSSDQIRRISGLLLAKLLTRLDMAKPFSSFMEWVLYEVVSAPGNVCSIVRKYLAAEAATASVLTSKLEEETGCAIARPMGTPIFEERLISKQIYLTWDPGGVVYACFILLCLEFFSEHIDKGRAHQGPAMLGIAFIATAEELGAEMAIRSLEHLSQYGRKFLWKRSVKMIVQLMKFPLSMIKMEILSQRLEGKPDFKKGGMLGSGPPRQAKDQVTRPMAAQMQVTTSSTKEVRRTRKWHRSIIQNKRQLLSLLPPRDSCLLLSTPPAVLP